MNEDRLYFWLSLSPIILTLFLSIVLLILLNSLPAKLPLFYSLPWGTQQLATKQQFLILPAIITLVALLNLIISWQLHHSQIFFKKILLFSSMVISLILALTFIKIVLIFV